MFNFISFQKKKIAITTILAGLLSVSTVTPASAAIPATFVVKGVEIIGTAVVSKVAEKFLDIVYNSSDASEEITNADSVSKANRTAANSAMQKYQAGEYPAAVNLWTFVIDNMEKQGVTVPKEYYKNRAAAYTAMGDTNNAISDLNRAITIDPRYTKAYNDCAVLYAQIGNNAAAQRDFERASRIDPADDDLPYNIAILHVNVGREQQRINSLEDVHSVKSIHQTSASSVNPLVAKLYRDQVSAKTSSTETEYKIAIDNFTAAIKLNPKNANAYRLRGLLYKELKEEEKAKEDFAMAKKLDPSLSIPDETK